MAEDSLTHKTVIGAGWMMAWRFVTRLLGLGSTLVLARLLMPGDFGIVAMASVFAAIVDALSQLGLQDALVRHPRDDRDLFNTAFTLQVLRALLIAAILAAGAPVAAWWFAEPRLIAVLLVSAAATVVAGWENIGVVEFRRKMRYDKQFRLNAVPRLVQVAATVSLAFALHSYWALLIGIFIGRSARVVMSYFVHSYRPWFALAGWRELAGFSFWTWATSSAGVVWDRCDAAILGPALGPAGLGIYLVGLELAVLPVSEFVAPAAEALFSAFASAQKRGSATGETAGMVAVTLLMLTAPLILAISAGASQVVTVLLGAKWQSAEMLVTILAWQCIFSPFAYVSSMLLVARGQVRANFLINVVAAVIKLSVLLAVTRITTDLSVIALTITFVVAAEAVTFLVVLHRLDGIGARAMFAGIARTGLGLAAGIALLLGSGQGWWMGAMPVVDALLHGLLVGALVAAGYLPVVVVAWYLAGRPEGPETQLFSAASRFIGLVPRWARIGTR
jgi:lipopolysaccharide exporter